MWFKLTNADFSNNNLGLMSELSTKYWTITKNLANFTETSLNPVKHVLKNEPYFATFALNEACFSPTYKITMNDIEVTSDITYDSVANVLTVSIDSVVGPITITTHAFGMN